MSDKEIDKALYANLGEEGIIRMKAVEFTIEFMRDRPITNFKAWDEAFERVYNSLKNGVEPQQENGNNR